MKNCLLDQPEVVKGFIAEKNCSNAFKETLIEAYDLYCQATGIVWNKPFYERYDKLRKIPSEEKLNMIIARSSKKVCIDVIYDERFGNSTDRAYLAETKRHRFRKGCSSNYKC
jgi:hypothetical protein